MMERCLASKSPKTVKTNSLVGSTNMTWTKLSLVRFLAVSGTFIVASIILRLEIKRTSLLHSPNEKPAILFTPQFSAEIEPSILNVHVVPHTHDDVGWLKTVEQYYYGFNSTIQHAHVQAILDSTVAALQRNPNRTFTYVEQRFFSMWWNEQTVEIKSMVKKMVEQERFSFVNGGWCMHDEAASHFMGMIDQTQLGHDFLKKELGVVPTVGWQLDPFGHSSSQASFMTSLMGFDALYFGRIDYQDLESRKKTKECEGLWDASPDVGAPVFWGLTGSYNGNYGAPSGFGFDSRRDDEPLVGLDEETLLAKIKNLVQFIKTQSDETKGRHIMLTMGEDFNYENAEVYMKNIDLMIHSLHKLQESKQIDAASVLGPRFERINIFYSTPVYYTRQKFDETRRVNSKMAWTLEWSTKKDDFFPYAEREHSYWTGYFTSRTGFKRLERVASSFLMAARQIESFHLPQSELEEDCKCMEPLFILEDALGIGQHHDAISGTAKQHVANDYARRVQAGLNHAAEFSAKTLKRIMLGQAATDDMLIDFGYCQLLNETRCVISEEASSRGDDIYLVVYNALATARSAIIGIPVTLSGMYEVLRIDTEDLFVVATTSKSTYTDLPDDIDNTEVAYFETGPLPPTGAVAFKVSFVQEGTTSTHRAVQSSISERHLTGFPEVMVSRDGSLLLQGIWNDAPAPSQRFGYYASFDASMHGKPGDQSSGAYIFRPSKPNEELKTIAAVRTEKREISDLVREIIVEYEVPWVKQVFKLYKDSPTLEIEYTVGPIPIDDGLGKELVTQYSSDIESNGIFYTDSNGREFQKRFRSSRPSWNLTENEPIAGNYYPVNAAIYIRDSNKSMGLLTDRSQGGSSLKDGTIEIMVQRRTLQDDFKGVNEPLNETDGGVTPYPPYGDGKRYGEGIVVRGKHRLVLAGGHDGARSVRDEMDKAFSEPILFVGSSRRGSQIPFKQKSFQLIRSELPRNIMLITFKKLSKEPKASFLIRLGHQYATGDDKELSLPTVVDLEALFGAPIISCQEKTLSGNRDIEDWEKERLSWQGSEDRRQSRSPCQEDYNIEIKPMEIRTFHIRVDFERRR